MSAAALCALFLAGLGQKAEPGGYGEKLDYARQGLNSRYDAMRRATFMALETTSAGRFCPLGPLGIVNPQHFGDFMQGVADP